MLVRALSLALPILLSVLIQSGCAASPAPSPEAPAASAASAAREQAPARRLAELPATEVVQHLRGNETELRRCFFANPSLHGAATFTWRVDEAGKVHGVRREASTLSDPQVASCIKERLSEIRFGDRAQEMRAHWTFVFRLADTTAQPKPGRANKRKRHRSEDERGVVIDPNSPGVLPPEAIDNVVEAGYPLFARCYRDGVNRNDALGGTVRLRFVVSAAGVVSEVSDGGSDLSDRQVVDCIAEGFYALRFPEPQHGSVQVLYRIGFQAG